MLVQLWGADNETTRQLVTDLLADPLIGVLTSAAMNDAGRQLDEFDTTEALVEDLSGAR